MYTRIYALQYTHTKEYRHFNDLSKAYEYECNVYNECLSICVQKRIEVEKKNVVLATFWAIHSRFRSEYMHNDKYVYSGMIDPMHMNISSSQKMQFHFQFRLCSTQHSFFVGLLSINRSPKAFSASILWVIQTYSKTDISSSVHTLSSAFVVQWKCWFFPLILLLVQTFLFA